MMLVPLLINQSTANSIGFRGINCGFEAFEILLKLWVIGAKSDTPVLFGRLNN